MKILAFEKEAPGVEAHQFAPLLEPEARRVWELYCAGVIREMHFRADRHEAVLVLECPTVDEAQRAIDTLPLVQAGLITFEIIPLVPYTGFERLFGQKGQEDDRTAGDPNTDLPDHRRVYGRPAEGQ